ncbi:hypothetical protein QR98_0099120 [Sarcoptes scabiei]|uniref:Uncharacterized protein n=1 Tax=Sarcoptes scabiei TaxID=52283 RepID=A0A132AK48_SARSC|nr:hypothetical protein QR98_0099120 [Sarcoptes scabiei]
MQRAKQFSHHHQRPTLNRLAPILKSFDKRCNNNNNNNKNEMTRLSSNMMIEHHRSDMNVM